MMLLAASTFAADSVVKVVGPDSKPVPNFNFMTRPAASRNYAEMQQWRTDASGECQLANLKGSGQYILTWAPMWTEKGLMEKGTQTTSLSGGKTLTITLKTITLPKGCVAASMQTSCRQLSSFCLNRDDQFLLCDPSNRRIRVVGTDDKLVKDLDLGFGAQVVGCRADGTVVAAGGGKIVLLDAQGNKQAEAALPGKAATATSVGASGKDIFVCVMGNTGFAIHRYDDKLQNPTEIIKGLRGCCGQMDFGVRDGNLYVAHNTKFLVEKYNRDGKLLSSFGKRDNGSRESFKGCCEPKNVCFDTQGNVYTAESANWSVKKFSPTGNYINFIGAVAEVGDCVRVTLACTKDNRIFILDTAHNIIRPVLPGKSKDVNTGRS